MRVASSGFVRPLAWISVINCSFRDTSSLPSASISKPALRAWANMPSIRCSSSSTCLLFQRPLLKTCEMDRVGEGKDAEQRGGHPHHRNLPSSHDRHPISLPVAIAFVAFATFRPRPRISFLIPGQAPANVIGLLEFSFAVAANETLVRSSIDQFSRHWFLLLIFLWSSRSTNSVRLVGSRSVGIWIALLNAPPSGSFCDAGGCIQFPSGSTFTVRLAISECGRTRARAARIQRISYKSQ